MLARPPLQDRVQFAVAHGRARIPAVLSNCWCGLSGAYLARQSATYTSAEARGATRVLCTCVKIGFNLQSLMRERRSCESPNPSSSQQLLVRSLWGILGATVSHIHKCRGTWCDPCSPDLMLTVSVVLRGRSSCQPPQQSAHVHRRSRECLK